MAKNKKVGSIAVPYLITIFVGILIIGGGTFFFLRHFGILGGEKELSEPSPRDIATTTYQDNHTVLFILDEPSQKCSTTFVVMRSIPKDKKLIFMSIPSNTISLVDGEQKGIKSCYEQGGAGEAVAFAETVLGIDIDRYMKLDSDSYVKICDILGGVTYPISEDIAGFNGDGSEQYLNSEQIDKLTTYALFRGGEYERSYTASSLVARMINQSDLVRVSDSLDNSFNSLVNMTDTDITAVDYKKYKTAIKTMLERGNSKSIATGLVLDGDDADSDYIPSQGFINDFKDKYYTQYEGK